MYSLLLDIGPKQRLPCVLIDDSILFLGCKCACPEKNWLTPAIFLSIDDPVGSLSVQGGLANKEEKFNNKGVKNVSGSIAINQDAL